MYGVKAPGSLAPGPQHQPSPNMALVCIWGVGQTLLNYCGYWIEKVASELCPPPP